MKSCEPQISVIIPTRNRRASLQRALAALDAQTFPLDEMEVIVVADGCTDSTAEMLRSYAAAYPLRIIEQPALGAAAARNAGAAAARGPLLLFLDDDVEPTPTLLEAHVRAHERDSRRVVLGPYPPVPRGGTDFLRILLRNWYDDQFSARAAPGHRFTYLDMFGGNVSMTATLFARAGGFDPTIPGCGGEDWELGIRLLEADASFRFVPEALAFHHEHETTDLDRFFRRARQEGRVDIHIGQRHPRVKPVLPLARPPRRYAPLHALVRYVAFHWPAAGDRAAASVRTALQGLERGRLRRQWRFLCMRLHGYWYWRGVGEALHARGLTLREFLGKGPVAEVEHGPDMEIDLREGIAAAERCVDEEQPASVRLRHGDHPIGEIPPHPAAERLKGVHLRSLLASRVAPDVLSPLWLRKGAAASDLESCPK